MSSYCATKRQRKAFDHFKISHTLQYFHTRTPLSNLLSSKQAGWKWSFYIVWPYTQE